MIPVHFLSLAGGEYRSARNWDESRDVSAAINLVHAFDAAIERIQVASDSQPVVSGEYRWVRVRKFPFRLIYRCRPEGDAIIVAVAHTSRRPGYWRRRK